MSHNELVECQRKNCFYNCWGILSGYHCIKTIVHIDKKGICSDYIKDPNYKPVFKGDEE